VYVLTYINKVSKGLAEKEERAMATSKIKYAVRMSRWDKSGANVLESWIDSSHRKIDAARRAGKKAAAWRKSDLFTYVVVFADTGLPVYRGARSQKDGQDMLSTVNQF
jgi:hypothetical protein